MGALILSCIAFFIFVRLFILSNFDLEHCLESTALSIIGCLETTLNTVITYNNSLKASSIPWWNTLAVQQLCDSHWIVVDYFVVVDRLSSLSLGWASSTFNRLGFLYSGICPRRIYDWLVQRASAVHRNGPNELDLAAIWLVHTTNDVVRTNRFSITPF